MLYYITRFVGGNTSTWGRLERATAAGERRVSLREPRRLHKTTGTVIS